MDEGKKPSLFRDSKYHRKVVISMPTHGLSPVDGYVATRDRLKSLRESGTPFTTENPAYWFAMKTGGHRMPSSMVESEASTQKDSTELPDWLQYL